MSDDDNDLLDEELLDADADDEEIDALFGEGLAVEEEGDDEEDDGGLFDEDDGEIEDDGTESLEARQDDDTERPGEPAVDLSVIDGLEVDDPTEVADEVTGDADDHVRDGEFVCRSCHMAKRASALADADELLCRDCV